MTLNLHLPAKHDLLKPTITVIGVGGAGGNAVNNMIAAQLEGVNFVVANTDAQAIEQALTERRIQLGANITKGLGAGANPEIGRAAAEEAAEEISAHIDGSNMVFITAGMGGGTGTGAASVVARLAREQGVLTVAVVTKPFHFEGSHRMRLAEAGLKELQEFVDTLIIIPNQNLFRIATERTTFADAFRLADEVLHSGVRGVTDLMVKPGLINLDFADIRTVMREMGKAMMGTGEATGEKRAIEAAEAAISNPLLDDVSLKGARAALINITGGPDMTLFEVDEAANRIRQEVDPEANIIFGSAFSDSMEGRMRVSVVATGIDAAQIQQQARGAQSGDIKKPYLFSAVNRADSVKSFQRANEVPPSSPQQQQQPGTGRAQGGMNTEAKATATFRAMSEVKSSASERRDMRETGFEAPRQASHAEETLFDHQEYAAHEGEEEQQEERPLIAERMVSHPSAQGRRPQREVALLEDEETEAPIRGLFSRIANVGRAFAQRDESYARPEPEARSMQVTEKPRPESKPAAGTQEDQYLDIPAFLRRQVN